MGNRLNLRLSGVSELRHAITAYGARLVQASVDAVTDATEDTVLKARYLAPVKTGELQRSITGRVTTDGYSVTGTVRAAAKHARVVEFGTQRTQKKPFLLAPAIQNRRRLTRTLQSAVVTHAPDGLGTPTVTGEGPVTPGIGGGE